MREVSNLYITKAFSDHIKKFFFTGIMHSEVFVVSQCGKNLQTLARDLMGWWLKYIRKGRSNMIQVRWIRAVQQLPLCVTSYVMV